MWGVGAPAQRSILYVGYRAQIVQTASGRALPDDRRPHSAEDDPEETFGGKPANGRSRRVPSRSQQTLEHRSLTKGREAPCRGRDGATTASSGFSDIMLGPIVWRLSAKSCLLYTS